MPRIPRNLMCTRAAAGLAALLLLSACAGDDADPDAAATESATPTPSVSAPTATPTPTQTASPAAEPITACPPAEEVAQSLGLPDVLPQSDYAEIQRKAKEAGAQTTTSSADPGCAYGEDQSLSFQVFDATQFGGGTILIDGLKSNFDCAAGDCEIVTDEGGVYTVVFESDAAGRVLAATASGQYGCGFTFLVDGADAAAQARQTAARTGDFLKGICGA